jgi:sugar O-acyltransferase (sialic acid O-acetyltransferase NeuD family)
MKTLAILGASGHGRVVADAALSARQWDDVIFFDDAWPRLTRTGPWNVIGTIEAFKLEHGRHGGCCVAIGDNRTRLRVHRELEALGANLVSIIHPSAVVSPHAELAGGCVILANAVVAPFARLGRSCIVNNAASVDHDCELGDAVHVSPGARLGGNVRVGDAVWIGMGATVKHDVGIGSEVTIGAGAVVVKDVAGSLTVVGVPAKPLRTS